MDQVLLHQGDESEHVVRKRLRPAHLVQRAELLWVDVGKDLAHDDPFLEAVHEQAVSVGRVVAQQSRAEAVERGDPRLAVVVAQPLVDAARDLARRAVREREDEDPVATRDALAHGLLVKVDQRMRLARAWSGQHAHWSIHFVDVDGHRVSRVGGGRPDYAVARLLESAHAVKGSRDASRMARKRTISSHGHCVRCGLSPCR